MKQFRRVAIRAEKLTAKSLEMVTPAAIMMCQHAKWHRSPECGTYAEPLTPGTVTVRGNEAQDSIPFYVTLNIARLELVRDQFCKLDCCSLGLLYNTA